MRLAYKLNFVLFLSFFGCIRCLLEWRQSRRRRGILDWHSKSDADKETLIRRVQNSCHDADDFAPRSYQRPAGAARIGGGVKLNEIGQHAFSFRRDEFAPQSGDYSRRCRWSNAERKTDGDDLIADGKIRG